MKVLLIDNFDSFTYNLYQYVGSLLQKEKKSSSVKVIRNNEWSLSQVHEFAPTHIIISPGPGNPSEVEYFGICGEVIRTLGKTIPTLGVCLGMQGICNQFGAKIVHAKIPMHGKLSSIVHDSQGVFQKLPQEIEIMRYHSLVAERTSLPPELEITCVVSQGLSLQESLAHEDEFIEIMGVRHKTYPIEGIQFHPESFGTEGGLKMLQNFLSK